MKWNLGYLIGSLVIDYAFPYLNTGIKIETVNMQFSPQLCDVVCMLGMMAE